MRLTKKSKQVAAFLAIWCGIAGLFAVFATFPKLIATILLIACAVMLLITTWQLVGTYIDE